MDTALDVSTERFEDTARFEHSAAVDPTLITADDELVDADLLVEDVSIDGMCGVY